MPFKDPEKEKEYKKQYRKKNRDHTISYLKDWRKRNPNYQNERRKKNPEKIRGYDRERYKRDHEKRLGMVREYWNTNKDQINKQRRTRYNEDEEFRKERLESAKKWRAIPSVKKMLRDYNKQYKIDNKERVDKITYKSQLKYLKKLAVPLRLTEHAYKRALQSWSNLIKQRDKVCQICGGTHNLEAHHIIYRSDYPLLSFNMNNGILLCQTCHYQTHSKTPPS